jgi:hypothetical protein
VVRLFNAVAKAQKQVREAEALGKDSARLSKASFFADLKGQKGSTKSSMGAVMKRGGDNEEEEGRGGGTGWAVLDGDLGLGGGGKMKDWDREVEGGELNEQLEAASDDDEGSSDDEDMEEEMEEEDEDDGGW